MIRLEGVTKRYADITAVDDLTMEVAEGEIAVLLGPSGCGKTTTLRAINRMVDIDAGTITVSTGYDDKMVRVAVADTGRGIAPEDLDSIFDPGFTLKGVGVGVALGLPTCARIVHKHGGTIEVASEVGKGSTFTVSLPVVGPATLSAVAGA